MTRKATRVARVNNVDRLGTHMTVTVAQVLGFYVGLMRERVSRGQDVRFEGLTNIMKEVMIRGPRLQQTR